jgi:hypothetical protein
VKDTKDGKVLNVVLRTLKGFALQVVTMAHIEDKHDNKRYKKYGDYPTGLGPAVPSLFKGCSATAFDS